MSLNPNRLFRVMCFAISWAPLASTDAAAQPAQISPQEHQRLVEMFYDKRYDPMFDGDFHFNNGVPLICPSPDCSPAAQYWTSLVIVARRACLSVHLPRVEQIYRDAVAANAAFAEIPFDDRRTVIRDLVQETLGPLEEESLIPNDLRPGHAGTHSHPHPHSFESSGLIVTSGLHALRHVDAVLKAGSSLDDQLGTLLHTNNVQWRVLNRQDVAADECERLVKRYVPFVAHRPDGDYLVCGFARDRGSRFLMGFDLSEIERRVRLRSGYAIPYSKYVGIKEEAQQRDPSIKYDPLFQDFRSFFSTKNVPGFRLMILDGPQTVSTIYAADIDRVAVRALADTKIANAVRLADEAAQGKNK